MLEVKYSGVAGPKFYGGGMFDFKRASVFLFETPLLKVQND